MLYGFIFPMNDTSNADVLALNLMFKLKLPFCYQAKLNPNIPIKGTDKTFA